MRCVAAVSVALGWRFAAFVWPSEHVVIEQSLQVPVALLGVLFLSCGAYVYVRRRDAPSFIFFVYGLGNAVHWGGSVAAPGAAELAMFFVYLSFTGLGDAALLHLALIYPSRAVVERRLLAVLYLPALAAMALAPIAGLLSLSILGAAAAVILLAANLLSLIAGVAFVWRYVGLESRTRRASKLGPVIYAGIPSAVVGLLGAGGAFPGHPDALNLLLGIFVVTLGFALAFNTLGSDRVRSDSMNDSALGRRPQAM